MPHVHSREVNPGTCADLPLFDPNSIEPDDFQVLNAPRNSGKSTTLYHWTTYMAHKIVVPIAISHSEKTKPIFETKFKIPRHFIFNQFDEAILESAFTRSEDLITDPPEGYSYLEHSMTHFFLDDVQDKKNLWHGPQMIKMARLGRHSNIGMTVCSQYMPSIQKGERSQFDRIALLYDEEGSNRHFCWQVGFSSWSWEQFNYYYEKYTYDYGCLIYSKKGGPKNTHFKASMDLLQHAEEIDLQWHPNSTIYDFARYYPLLDRKQQNKKNWNKAQYGLQEIIPAFSKYPMKIKRGRGK